MNSHEPTPRFDSGSAFGAGGPCDVDGLVPLAYEEMHRLAESLLQHCRPLDAARATSIIQDTYLRLANRGLKFQNQSHFLCVAAKAMRYVLIDRARKTNAAKRGGRQSAAAPGMLDVAMSTGIDDPRLISLDQALSRLATFDERKSRIVELRFFGGLSNEAVAEALELSLATVKREWALARAWLYREIGDSTHSV